MQPENNEPKVFGQTAPQVPTNVPSQNSDSLSSQVKTNPILDVQLAPTPAAVSPTTPTAVQPQVVGVSPAQPVTAPAPAPQSTLQGAVPTQPTPVNTYPDNASQTGGGKKWIIATAIAVPLVLLASAAAYIGVVLPNKPENVLKLALVSTMKAENISTKGTVDVDSDGTAVSVGFDLRNNNTKKLLAGQMDIAVSGVKVNAELRYVDQNAYLKLGDLKTVGQLAEGFAPGTSSTLEKLSNQWIEFDKTLLKQAGIACYLENSVTLSDADIKQLNTAYDKAPFMTIKQVSGDTIDGARAKKFELEMDNKKAIDFSQNTVAKLDSFKKLESCAKGQTDKLAAEATKDTSKTPLTVWVGSGKIVKVASKFAGKSTDDKTVNGSISMTLDYKTVTVDKPTGAIPAMDLMTQIQQQMQAAQSSAR